MTTQASERTSAHLHPRLLAGAGAVLAVPPILLCSISGRTGEEVVRAIRERVVPLEVGAFIAAIAAALLLVAAVRLASAIPGTPGKVAGASGAAVAVVFAAYYGVFGASAATVRLAETSTDGLGEAVQLLMNVVDYARYGPGLALVLSAVAARHRLPRGVWVGALVLAVVTVVPLTTWAAAALIPLWLGTSAAWVDAD